MPQAPTFHVICSVWNAESFIGRCLGSIARQTYPHFRCVVVDDCSTDNTYEIVAQQCQLDERFSGWRNSGRVCSIDNHIQAVNANPGDASDVIVVVDGDDWLKHDRVFERLAELYRDEELWLTYGSFQKWRNRRSEKLNLRCERGYLEPYPDFVARANMFRYFPYYAGHLRTFRRFLWNTIHDADLRAPDGTYFKTARDFAAMIPMLEMAGFDRIRYLDELLYVYNHKNPNGIRHNNREAQKLAELTIRSYPRYERLAFGHEE